MTWGNFTQSIVDHSILNNKYPWKIHISIYLICWNPSWWHRLHIRCWGWTGSCTYTCRTPKYLVSWAFDPLKKWCFNHRYVHYSGKTKTVKNRILHLTLLELWVHVKLRNTLDMKANGAIKGKIVHFGGFFYPWSFTFPLLSASSWEMISPQYSEINSFLNAESLRQQYTFTFVQCFGSVSF